MLPSLNVKPPPRLLPLLLLFFTTTMASALEFSFAYVPQLRIPQAPAYFHDFVIAMSHVDEVFFVSAALAGGNDRTYASSHDLYWNDHFFRIQNAGIGVRLGPLALRGGRFAHDDVLDAPYSLFVSSRDLHVPLAEISYSDGVFSYLSRWIGLTMYSALAYPNRGAVVKWYGLDLGAVSFGFQDAVVYTNRVFDFEYFVSPIPGFFTQYTQTGVDAPWRRAGNDNSIMGFYGRYEARTLDVSAQVLIDDANSNFLFDPQGVANPFKMAWMLAAGLDTAAGRFSFDHAGATKYTFQPFGSPGYLAPYGYTYIPDTAYDVDGERRAIDYQDNAIGYLYGENNLAFRLSWSRPFSFGALSAFLEYRVSGSKSPANPWHDFLWYAEGGEGTRLLDEELLEHRLLGEVGLSGLMEDLFGESTGPGPSAAGAVVAALRPFLNLRLRAGVAVNPLTLRDPVLHASARENRIPLYAPQEGLRPIFEASLELGFVLGSGGESRTGQYGGGQE